jgi:hypothetical protein
MEITGLRAGLLNGERDCQNQQRVQRLRRNWVDDAFIIAVQEPRGTADSRSGCWRCPILSDKHARCFDDGEKDFRLL